MTDERGEVVLLYPANSGEEDDGEIIRPRHASSLGAAHSPSRGRGTVGTAAQIAHYRAAWHAWEAANALPSDSLYTQAHRDAQLYAVAVMYGLLPG